jgi:hypothetical protein
MPLTYKPNINATPIDPEIRDLIKTLNKQGLETNLSCSGHMVAGYRPAVKIENFHEGTLIGNKWGPSKLVKHYTVYNKGYVMFTGSKFKEQLAMRIMASYGLKGLKGYLVDKGKHVVIVFDAIGHKGNTKNCDKGEEGISASFKI